MRARFGERWVSVAALVAVAVVAGVGLALASSLQSWYHTLPRGEAGVPEATATLTPFATPEPSPSPTIPPVLKPGQLGSSVVLSMLGTRLLATSAARSIVSTDGSSWKALPAGVDNGPVMADPTNPSRFVSGGGTIQVSTDGGANWVPTQHVPPGGGPYQTLAISPTEPDVWFFVNSGRLARTRDAGVSWKVFPGFAGLAAQPLLVPGNAKGLWFIAVRDHVYEFDDNAQLVKDLGKVPNGHPVVQLLQSPTGGPGVLLARTDDAAVFGLAGGSWADVHPALGGPLGGAAGKVAFLVDGVADLGVQGEIVWSTDGGQTWKPATGLPVDQGVLSATANADGTTAYAYCSGGDLYQSQDGGQTWSLLSKALRTP